MHVLIHHCTEYYNLKRKWEWGGILEKRGEGCIVEQVGFFFFFKEKKG